MDRDFVHRSLRRLALMGHVATSLFKTATLHEVAMIDKAASKLDDELSTYIATHAKAECMTLSQKIQGKLPRELRDMVYAHLLSRETYIVRQPNHNLKWLQSLRKTSCDHLLMGGYLLFDTMKEIGETWYELSTFVVMGFPYGRGSDPKRASGALDFLHDDSWGLGIDVCQHVKHIYIRLEYVKDVHDNIIQLAANLRRLLSLGAKVRQVKELVMKLQAVFPVLEELVKGGKRVMVNVKDYNVFGVKVEKLNAPSWIGQLTKVLSDKDLLVLEP